MAAGRQLGLPLGPCERQTFLNLDVAPRQPFVEVGWGVRPTGRTSPPRLCPGCTWPAQGKMHVVSLHCLSLKNKQHVTRGFSSVQAAHARLDSRGGCSPQAGKPTVRQSFRTSAATPRKGAADRPDVRQQLLSWHSSLLRYKSQEGHPCVWFHKLDLAAAVPINIMVSSPTNRNPLQRPTCTMSSSEAAGCSMKRCIASQHSLHCRRTFCGTGQAGGQVCKGCCWLVLPSLMLSRSAGQGMTEGQVRKGCCWLVLCRCHVDVEHINSQHAQVRERHAETLGLGHAAANARKGSWQLQASSPRPQSIRLD